MSAVLIIGSDLLPDWSTGSMLSRMSRLLLLIVVAVIAYFGALIALRFKLKQFIKRIE